MDYSPPLPPHIQLLHGLFEELQNVSGEGFAVAVELKPCPFCGGDVKIIMRSASMMNMVYHKDGGNGCYIAGPFKIPVARAHSLKVAVEAWNRRVNDG